MAARRRGSSIADAIQSANATLRVAEWMPMTAVRVLIGIFFCISGGTKLLVPAQFTLMEQTLAPVAHPLSTMPMRRRVAG